MKFFDYIILFTLCFTLLLLSMFHLDFIFEVYFRICFIHVCNCTSVPVLFCQKIFNITYFSKFCNHITKSIIIKLIFFIYFSNLLILEKFILLYVSESEYFLSFWFLLFLLLLLKLSYRHGYNYLFIFILISFLLCMLLVSRIHISNFKDQLIDRWMKVCVDVRKQIEDRQIDK